MNTIVVNIHDAAQDLEFFIKHLLECGGRVVLAGESGPLAEITPLVQPNPIDIDRLQQPPNAEVLD